MHLKMWNFVNKNHSIEELTKGQINKEYVKG